MIPKIMTNKAFIELKFNQETKDLFNNFINNIVTESMLYYSPVVEHIKGNMSKTLHCTALFGLHEQYKDNLQLKEIIKSNFVSKIELGKLFFINGYQDLYKVLVIEILDTSKELANLHNALESFAVKENPRFKSREFKPHLTLAYVENDYEIPMDLPMLPSSIEVDGIDVSLLFEFNKTVNL
jgi:hypothetical protein